MRVKISFSATDKKIPIQNQHLINSYVHKCLGVNNKYHDAKNDYCISQLYGGTLNKEDSTLSFNNGGYIVASSLDGEFINTLLMGVLNNQEFIYDMAFNGIEHINEVFYNGWNHFSTLSPFLIRTRISDEKYGFLTLDDIDFESKVKEYLITKLKAINPNLILSNFDIKIPDIKTKKIKKILIKNVINKANQCQIDIYTNKEVAELLYNIGIGMSTGSGFGTIYKTENNHLYRSKKMEQNI